MGVGIKADMKRLITIGEGFPDGLQHLFDSPVDNSLPPGDRLLCQMSAATPGTLNRTSPSDRKMIEG